MKRLSRNRPIIQERIGCFAELISFNEELITEVERFRSLEGLRFF
jgi:hypothetical protein